MDVVIYLIWNICILGGRGGFISGKDWNGSFV